MANVTTNQETIWTVVCASSMDTVHYPTYIAYMFPIFAVFNIVLSLTASVGNIFVLVALYKITVLHPPSKLLFRVLASTDLCVGLISQPFFAAYLWLLVKYRCNIAYYLGFATYLAGAVLCGVSLWTVTAISVDRLLALLLGIRYKQVVTVRRVRLAVVFFWLQSIATGLIYLWSEPAYFISCSAVILLCQGTSNYCYTKIHLTIRHQQTQVRDIHDQVQGSGGISPNILQYKKTVSSSLWVHSTMVACYTPHAILTALTTVYGPRFPFKVAESFTASLIYLNSTLNPLLYCWKIREVRHAVKETFSQIKGLFN